MRADWFDGGGLWEGGEESRVEAVKEEGIKYLKDDVHGCKKSEVGLQHQWWYCKEARKSVKRG